MQRWILSIQKTSRPLIHKNYCIILQIKWILRGVDMLHCQNLPSTAHREIQRSKKIINLKYHLHYGIKNWNYLMVHTMYQIFNSILNISPKAWNTDWYTTNPDTITLKIKSGYYLKFSTSETMKILGHTERRMAKDEMVKKGHNQKLLTYYY